VGKLSAEGAIQSPRQKRIAIARVENGFDHIEGSESRFQPRKLSGFPRLLLSPAPLALKIAGVRIVLPVAPGLPYVLRRLAIE
jgi:hypothetical protein